MEKIKSYLPSIPSVKYDVSGEKQVVDTETVKKLTSRRGIAVIMAVLGSVLLIGVIVAIALSVKGGSGTPVDQYTSQDPLGRAKEILKRVSMVDGHNDFAYQLMLNFDGRLGNVDMHQDLRQVFTYNTEAHPSQTDIPRLRKGVVGAQMWSAFAPCYTQFRDALKKGLESVDVIKRFSNKFNDTFDFVTTADGMLDAHARGKIASMIGLEGGHMIDSSLSLLRMYYELGTRYMTLTHSCNTPWANGVGNDPSTDSPRVNGLSPWGRRVVLEMNRLGMMVDIAHVTYDTMKEALRVSEAPVIFSHSQAYKLCPHPRNAPDDVLRKLKTNNGIIMVNFYPDFINCTMENRYTPDNRTASLGQLADHIDHIKSITGPNHIGIGAAYDAISHTVDDVEDTSRYPFLFAELIRRGWTDDELEKLAFKNFYRVFKAVETVRDMKRNQAPDDTLIGEDDIYTSERSCMTFSWDGSDPRDVPPPQTTTTSTTEPTTTSNGGYPSNGQRWGPGPGTGWFRRFFPG